ncbi:MAG: T9SS type A sorting domain-containing protein [Bacteroidia bacterium]|nr:T9SS type A sorting domain-containing protein [Bacteroidia bacterium]
MCVFCLGGLVSASAQGTCPPGGCKGPNLVLNGNFEVEITDPNNPLVNFSSDLSYIVCPPANTLELWGRITLLQDPNICYFAWSGNDHTYDNGEGHMLVVDFPAQNPNGSSSYMNLWATSVTVTPGETYCFGAWYKNLNTGAGVSKPRFRYVVNGTLIGFSPNLPDNGQWYYYGYNYTVPAGVTSLTIEIENGKWGGAGNDLAIDDIEFREVRAGANTPIANDDQVIVLANAGSYPISVLANDLGNNPGFTPSAADMSLSSVPPSTLGSVVITPSGQIDFSPAVGFVGDVSFKYEICHPSGCCTEAMVTVSVDNVLPAQVENFAAKMQNNHAKLTWTTLTEVNNHHFEIERSVDREAYVKAGEVGGVGYSTTRTEYEFTDMQVRQPGVSRVYYRLRQVDMDGRTSVGSVVEVNVSANSEAGLVVKTYPNPVVDDVFKVEIGTNAEEAIIIQLISLNGQVVRRQMLPGVRGHRIVKMDVNGLAGGMYLLSVSQGSKTVNQRMVITP